jgi:hypothetical protein
MDGSPHVIRLRRSLYGTSMPGAGAVHHIKKGRAGRLPARLDLPRKPTLVATESVKAK